MAEFIPDDLPRDFIAESDKLRPQVEQDLLTRFALRTNKIHFRLVHFPGAMAYIETPVKR
jgi:hypothetical protein